MAELIEVLGRVRSVQIIASGRGVRVRAMLKQQFGGEHWRKLKGIAVVRDRFGDTYEAEIHWYECHGVGRRLVKVKERTTG